MHLDWPEIQLDRPALLVWVAMLVVGAAAWVGSGTPVAGAAIVVAVLLAAASPSGALFGVCAAIPLIFHPIEVGSLQLGLLEIGILATALGTGVRWLYDQVMGNPWPVRAMGRPWFSLALPVSLLGVGTLSLLWMPFDLHRAEALRSWRWVIVEPVIVFVLARVAIARDGRAPLALAVAIPASLVAVAGMWQLLTATSSFSVDDVHRSTATYLHPNNLALYLERAIFLVLVPAIALRGRRRMPFMFLSAVIALGIGATFSRGAFLALIAGGAVVLLVRPIRRGWSIFAIGMGLLAIVFGALASRRLTGSDSSGIIATRKYLWTDAAHMLRDFPLTGIGLDQFLWLHQQRYIDPRIWAERYTSHPHNLLLDAWLSLGAPGVVLLAGFCLAGGWVIWTVRRGSRTLDVWQLGALASLAAGLGHGMVDNGYFLPDLAVLTWLGIALVVSSGSPTLEAVEARPDV